VASITRNDDPGDRGTSSGLTEGSDPVRQRCSIDPEPISHRPHGSSRASRAHPRERHRTRSPIGTAPRAPLA